MIRKLILPGLIDPHVHLRDPGQTHKEDFYTGTCAALAGGFTTIFDMPNNKVPVTTSKLLNEKIKIAKKKIVCDVGFYFGSMGDNLDEFRKVKDKVMGLKLYLNQTTGNFIVQKNILESIFTAWLNAFQSIALHSSILSTKNVKPILVHAEGKKIEDVINVVKKIKTPTHFCHISQAFELKMIIHAKEQGLPITCGVTPHHLFLNEKDAKILGPFGKMRPPLQSKKDVEFLWENLKYINVVESDHAPHTIAEKVGKTMRVAGAGDPVEQPQGAKRLRMSDGGKARQDPQILPPFGVPGFETTLPLLLTAVSEKRLTLSDIIRLCHTNPAKIFGIKVDKETYTEVDLNSSFIIHNSSLFTKCGWSPFEGMKVKGKVVRVFIRGKKVFENGKILAKEGFGKIITASA